MIDFGYNNKKTNIKVNILLAAFLEIELYDNIDCHVMINSLFKKNIGIWSYIHKTDDGSYRLRIYVDSDNKRIVILHKIKFDDKVSCFKAGLKIILAYICCLANDDKNKLTIDTDIKVSVCDNLVIKVKDIFENI